MPTPISAATRRAIIEEIPWVTRIKALGVPCTGFMAHTAIKHVYGTSEQRAQKPSCKNPARWKFRALKRAKMPTRDGEYCWAHLMSRGLYGSMEEEARTRKWLRKHYPELTAEK